MAKKFLRKDFIVKDVAVSLGAAGRGGTWLPVDEDSTPPSPISPIASVVANLAHIEAVRGTIAEAMKNKQFDDIARAFVPGDAGGNGAIRTAIHEVGVAVVASAAFAGLGGAVGLVDPNCGGTSFETIPPTLTPVVHTGLAVHKVADLQRLKSQLVKSMAYLDRAVEAQAPQGEEVAAVRAGLEGALKSLR